MSVSDERIEILLCSVIKNVTEDINFMHESCRIDSETEVTCYVCMVKSNGELEVSPSPRLSHALHGENLKV
jgi:hypothetical protein